MKSPLFYRDKPIFGFDVGHNSIKVMQLDTNSSSHRVLGYGYTTFDRKSVKDGAIVDVEAVAKEVYDMMTKHIVGTIDTKRVVSAVPIAQAYNRVMTLPLNSLNTIEDAIRIEVQQYIPIPIEDLYYDYEIGQISDKSDDIEVLIMASPKRVVNSYMKLFEALDLEVAAIETTISSSTRLVMHAEGTDVPTLIIDFGSVSTDLSIFDTTLRVTGTVQGGGDTITNVIAKEMGVTPHQAHVIKTKYGLSKSKHQIKVAKAIEPILSSMVVEIKKMIRFYQERTGRDRVLGQVIILGGGANMPGLSDYLTDKLRVPTRMCNPWLNLDFGDLQPPHQLEKTLYATVAGLALVRENEVSG